MILDSGKGQIESKKHAASQSIEEYIASLQDVAVGTLLKKHGIAMSDSAGPVSTITPFHLHLQGQRQACQQSLPGEASGIHVPSLPLLSKNCPQ